MQEGSFIINTLQKKTKQNKKPTNTINRPNSKKPKAETNVKTDTGYLKVSQHNLKYPKFHVCSNSADEMLQIKMLLDTIESPY